MLNVSMLNDRPFPLRLLREGPCGDDSLRSLEKSPPLVSFGMKIIIPMPINTGKELAKRCLGRKWNNLRKFLITNGAPIRS